METKKRKKPPIFFHCLICDYKTCKSSDYNRHILTQKHKWKQMETDGSASQYIPDEFKTCILDRADFQPSTFLPGEHCMLSVGGFWPPSPAPEGYCYFYKNGQCESS